jgi:hypothetical protein
VKRLLEEKFDERSPEHWLAELVRATPPLETTPFAEKRIFARVAGVRRPRHSLFARGAVVLVVLCAAAVAAAAGRSAWLARESRLRVAVASDATIPAAAPALPAARVALEAPAAVVHGDGPNALPRLDAPAPPSSLAVERERSSAPAPASGRGAPALAKPGEDSALVLSAIRALRQTGEPSQASALLGRYLKLYPNGSLAEDALALSIEAAAARHDDRARTDLGRRYLARYPSGRFRSVAIRATEQD